MRYASFEITEVAKNCWIARRTTKKALYQLSPKRSLRELKAAIDERNIEIDFEELIAA
jgi:hypothetical protein